MVRHTVPKIWRISGSIHRVVSTIKLGKFLVILGNEETFSRIAGKFSIKGTSSPIFSVYATVAGSNNIPGVKQLSLVQTAVPGPDSCPCPWVRQLSLSLGQTAAPVPGSDSCPCPWVRQLSLSPGQTAAPVPGSDSCPCPWARQLPLSLGQTAAPVPGPDSCPCPWARQLPLSLGQTAVSLHKLTAHYGKNLSRHHRILKYFKKRKTRP